MSDSDGPEVKGPVAEGEFAGLLDGSREVAAGKAQETLEHSDALDAAGLDHGLGPSGAVRAESIRDLPKSQAAPRSTPLIFSAAMYCVRGAEAARLLPDMHRDLLHPLVEDPHHAAVPAHPDLPRQVLRRHRVVGPLDLDVAVAMHDAAGFVKRRERLERQRQERLALRVGEVLADLTARGAVDPRVGHGQLPLAQEAVLLLQAGEDSPFEALS